MPNFDRTAWEDAREDAGLLEVRHHRPIPPIEERMSTLLGLIASAIRPCHDCGAKVAMVRHASGRRSPYTMDGINHALHCPKREPSK